MAAEETTNTGNVKPQFNAAQTGLNMDQSLAQIPKGTLTYALNAALENFDANSVNYQNEQGNELCLNFPSGFTLIGTHFIAEKNKHIFFLVNVDTNSSQIGYMNNNDCVYHTYVNADCLNFNVNFPVHKVVHKITNCTTEIYWTDGLNPRRYLDLDNIPAILDCNDLKIQPNFDIPQLDATTIATGGELIAGTYQFAIQYCDANGNPFTSYYSVTNPVAIANVNAETTDFNYPVNKSIVLNISNLDLTRHFEYYNIAVIKTINNITSTELVGTYFIDAVLTTLTYTGQNKSQIKLSISDIFEKFPYYDVAQDLTAVQDVLVWDNLISHDRINYQKIANKISLKWESYRLPAGDTYANGINSEHYRGYLRDEVYAFEIVFLLKNGKQTDGFHIPGRAYVENTDILPLVTTSNNDYIGDGTPTPRWKVYNTASYTATEPAYLASSNKPAYKGPYQYGEFSYWQSLDKYPFNTEVWGDLAGTPIRHHKFPDVAVSPVFESPTYTLSGSFQPVMQTANAIYPIGVRLDTAQVQTLINQAVIDGDITQLQADDIAGFKIVRADRSTHKSIVAKGMLRNVGKYNREGTNYYFPNYPYNDLRKDPFLLQKNNAYNGISYEWSIVVLTAGTYQYTDCFTGEIKTATTTVGPYLSEKICSITEPTPNTAGFLSVTKIDAADGPFPLKTYVIRLKGSTPTWFNCYTDTFSSFTFEALPYIANYVQSWSVPQYDSGYPDYTITMNNNINIKCYPTNLEAFATDESKFRMVFNSPETSFAKPALGNILKLENVLFGGGKVHFVKVEKNAEYKLITKETQVLALNSSYGISFISGTLNATAMFAAYQTYLQIYIAGVTRKNYAYSYNTIASYDYTAGVPNDAGIKQRFLDKYQYLIPGFQSAGDTYDVNNYDRESSVYLRTNISDTTVPTAALPYAQQTPSINSQLVDNSRITLSDIANGYSENCEEPEKLQDIKTLTYYASIKNIMPNQYGQIYSYTTIDTGLQVDFDSLPGITTVFGGDTFISRFSYKTKVPFFIDNRVGAPNDSDIEYDQLGNIAYPQYWHSSRSILSDYIAPNRSVMKNIVSTKAHFFDCAEVSPWGGTTTTTTTVAPSSTIGYSANTYPNSTFMGKMYMFAYGIPTFYCETGVNIDLRQAFNNKEGDFYPRVSSGIPDSWLQEVNVPITFDNTYYYNVSYSKQNTENYFNHLPTDWTLDNCNTYFPFRAVYSDQQNTDATNKVNSWLTYRATSYFDFPQNYGNLTSLDGIQNKAVLARFENKSLLYNTMLTINTSNPQAAYLGNDTLFKSAPPIDFAETDLGYVGAQNKMLLKIPQGQITADAKRGQIFLIAENGAQDLTAFGSGVNRFMTDHLAFEILRYFPEANTDNHFTGVGLHGVYDSKFDRVIITKRDYIPQPEWLNKIFYSVINKNYYIVVNNKNIVINLENSTYFCNKSWTLSFNMNTKSWVSFHSYIPNYYIAENNFFYSGMNEGCDLSAIAAIEIPEACQFAGTAKTNTPVPTNCQFTGTAQTTSPLPITTTTTSTSTSTSTTTSTTTVAPTTTTTSTTIQPPINLDALTAPTTESLCSGGLSEYLYTTDGALEVGVYIYEDSELTIPYTAYFAQSSDPLTWYGCLFDGQIAAIGTCATTTTTTTLPPTTTTTTTSTPSTTTTTTTQISTTTTTTTVAPVYSFTLCNIPKYIQFGLTGCDACNSYPNGPFITMYSNVDTLITGSILYNDPQLTNPYSGAGTEAWFALNNNGNISYTQIGRISDGNTGLIFNGPVSCSACTTTTTTTATPTTTTTTTETPTTTTTTTSPYKTFMFYAGISGDLPTVCALSGTLSGPWYFIGPGTYPTVGDTIYWSPGFPYALNGAWLKIANGHAINGDANGYITQDFDCSGTTTTTTTAAPTTTTTTTTVPATTTTTTTAVPTYTYLRYDVDTNFCTTSNPQPVWSYNVFGAGYYYINSNFSTYYYVSAYSHTDFTNQVSTIDPTSCAGTTTTTTTVAPTTTTTTTTAAPTTTTTTTAAGPTLYFYNAHRAFCGVPGDPCTPASDVVIRSSTPLSNGSWYSEGTISYQPYGGTSGPSYTYDVDGVIYTQASDCETACTNY